MGESVWSTLPIRKGSISLSLSFPLFTQKKECHILRVSLNLPLTLVPSLWSSYFGLLTFLLLTHGMPRTSVLVIPFAWDMLPEILLRLDILW